MLDHAIADSWKFLQLLRFRHQLVDGFRQTVNQFGGLLVAAIAPDDGAIYLQELRRFAQYAGNLFVVHAGDYRAILRRKKGEGHSMPFGISCSSRRRKSVERSPECDASNRYFLCKFEQTSLNRIHNLPTRQSRLRQPILAPCRFGVSWHAQVQPVARAAPRASLGPSRGSVKARHFSCRTRLSFLVACRVRAGPLASTQAHIQSLNPSGGSQ